MPFVILPLVGLLILVAQLVVDLGFFFTLFLQQHFFDAGDQARDGVLVAQDVDEFSVAVLCLNIPVCFDILIVLDFVLGDLFQLVAEVFNFVFDFLEEPS